MNNQKNSADSERITTALLLAAGTGSRLLPLTQKAPKCLTLVSEISILDRLMENLMLQGFKKLVIVTGHLSSIIEAFLGSKYKGIKITYVHSPLYQTTNNIYSLWMARDFMSEPFVLLESDLVFDYSLLNNMMFADRIAVAEINEWMNGTTVIIDSDQQVIEFNKNTKSIDGVIKYKTVNIYSFSLDSWKVITQRLNDHILEDKVNGYYETVFSELMSEGSIQLKAVTFDNKKWYEIDTILDLAEAVKLFPVSNDIVEKIPIIKLNDKTELKDKEVETAYIKKVNELTRKPSIISFVADLPNICSLFGLLSAFLGIYFAIQSSVYIAVIGLVWAVLFDWLDGFIASKMINRTKSSSNFGGNLDSLIDIVSFGVLPAIILMSYTEYNLYSILLGFLIICACAIRLSYFNVYGLTSTKKYTGLPVDYTGLLISFVFLFEKFFQIDKPSFSIGFAGLLIIVIILNLSTIQISKFSKKWLAGIAVYVFFVTLFLGDVFSNYIARFEY